MRDRPGWQIDRAKELRKERSKPERLLWSLLRPAKCKWPIWRSQHPFGERYIVDFCCLEAKLIVEVDGEWHKLIEDADRDRDEFLKREGYSVLRVAARDVLDDYGHVAWLLINEARLKLGAEPLPK